MANIDRENMLGVLDSFSKQCEEGKLLGKNIKVDLPINGIVFCGMGGSALPGEIVKGYIQVDVPVIVVRDYDLPGWVKKDTLVFAISYSGTTEETLSCMKQAKARGAKVVCIASGGKMKEMCEKTGTPFVKVPSGIQPRASTGYMTMPILNILMNSHIIDDCEDDMTGAIKVLKKDVRESAKNLAKRIAGKTALIYTSDRMIAVARLWKAAMNENAKTAAFFNVFPELNHNEMNGVINKKGDFYAIFIEDADDHERIKKRMEVTKEMYQEWECPVLILKLTGSNHLARIFSAFQMGGYVGYYLALEYETDPTPVDMVEDFKKKLGVYIK